MTSSLDLDEIYQFAIQLGKDAGKSLQDAAQQRMNGGDQLEEIEKLNSVDIVTKTDEGERPDLLRAHFCISGFMIDGLMYQRSSHLSVNRYSQDTLLTSMPTILETLSLDFCEKILTKS